MKLTLDEKKFDALQAALIREVVHEVTARLRVAGLQGHDLEEAVAGVAFGVAAAIDDAAAIEVDGVEVKPYLTFRGADDALIHCGENSATYGHVYGALKELFDV